MIVGPHGQEDGLEYEAAGPVPGVPDDEPCDCHVCHTLAQPATGDE